MDSSSPRALRRLAGALLALAVVPALAFAAVQLGIQSESEARLAQLRDDQLDGLLFSVNQTAWDVTTTWADRLDRAQATDHPRAVGAGGPATTAFLEATPAVRSVVVADTAFQSVAAVAGAGGAVAEISRGRLRQAVSDSTVEMLLAQRALGYRKLAPAPLPGGGLGFAFVTDRASGPPRVVLMVVDPAPFVEAVIMPTLREVGRGGIELGVFRDGTSEAVAATADLAHADVERERRLWLLPAYTVGARVGEGSAEAALRRRMAQSLWLLGGVVLVFGGGALLAWRGVRREVEVARLREAFVSNVSHELRTPLALIRLYAESLAEGRVPEAKKPRYYATLVAEAERLSRLVGNVLQVHRFERGTARLSRAPLDLGALAAEVAERYRPVVEREGCRLDVQLPPGPLPVLGNRDALSEALVNLLDNAVKYGGSPVKVSARAESGRAVVEVADRGPGVAPADRERVFDPFVRIQPESADGLVHTAKGTGLGLALVRRIADAHGGSATVDARDGGGSVFQIALPTHA
ncbi:sensor histidine kinase [Rubrivirga sp.]|uniref:sensor histidine kinase n=1 Tax=Rubrivirga sp. TaxID=1885344 RepID=UPI003B51B9F3